MPLFKTIWRCVVCFLTKEQTLLIATGMENRAGDERLLQNEFGLIRLLINQSDLDEVHRTSRFKRKKGPELAPVGLLHSVLRRRNFGFSADDLLELIIGNRVELETLGINGNTPLLHALFFTPTRKLLPIIKTFMKAGASFSAKNLYSEGCLQLLLRRLSACNMCDMPLADRESIICVVEIILRQKCGVAQENWIYPIRRGCLTDSMAHTLHCVETNGFGCRRDNPQNRQPRPY